MGHNPKHGRHVTVTPLTGRDRPVRRAGVALAAALVAFAGAVAAAPIAAADTTDTTTVVTPSSPHNWSFDDAKGNGGTGEFAFGPAETGNGAAHLAVTGKTQGYELGTTAYNGTPISDITGLSYWAYNASNQGPAALAVSLNIGVDIDGNGSYDGRLVFDPSNQHNPQSFPTETWQKLTPITSQWYLYISGGSSYKPTTNPCPQTVTDSSSPLRGTAGCEWNAATGINGVLDEFPNAKVSTGIFFKVGSGWTGFDGYVDDFAITTTDGTDTYDFEPADPATVVTVDGTSGTDSTSCGATTDPCLTIGQAVTNATPGETVNVRAGTYTPTTQITVDKAITITGAGNGDDPTVDTIIQGSASLDGLWLAAPTGESSGSVAVKNLRIAGFTGHNGISVREGNTSKVVVDSVVSTNNGNGIELHNPAESTGTTAYDVTIRNSSFTHNTLGMKVATTAGVANLDISGSHFDNNSSEGLDVEAENSQDAPLGSLTITDTTFNDNSLKGIYIASLTGPATLTGVTVDGSGTATGYGSGIEFNVYHSQGKTASITITDATVTGSGTDPDKGAAIKINARGDKGGTPANITSVTITGSTITGGTTGILLMTDHTASSTGTIGTVAVHKNTITGNTVAVHNTTTRTVSATGNYWGSGSPDFGSLLSQDPGLILVSPYYTDSGMSGSATTAPPAGATVTPDTAGNAAATQNQPIVVPSAGATTVTVTVAKGAQDAGVDYSATTTSGAATVPATTITTAEGTQVQIPATTITGDPSWDGFVGAPTVVDSGSVTGLPEGASVSLGVQVGSLTSALYLNSPARILMPGQAGQHVGFIDHAGTFTAIDTACTADDQTAALTQLGAGSASNEKACVITVGADLIVWTNHFSTFVTYGNPSTVNVTVDSMISLAMVTDTVDLEGVPGAAQTGTFTYTVTTNSSTGYSVSAKADQDELKSSNTSNTDTLPVGALTLGVTTGTGSGTASGSGSAVTTSDQTVYSQSARSAAVGDSLATPITVTIPFVNSDVYSGTMTFTATTK